MTAFLEKTPHPVTNRINAGCYVFRREVIDDDPAGRVLSVERETFPAPDRGGAVVMGYLDTLYWLDVGTPEAFVQGSCDLVLGRLASPALPGGVPGEALLLAGAQVDPGARVGGGTVVGAGCGDRGRGPGRRQRPVRRGAGRRGRAGQRLACWAAARGSASRSCSTAP